MDWQVGVPRNVIARFLSETKDPESDFQKLSTIKRSLGYNHNFVRQDGKIWNIECSATSQVLTSPVSPYVHTNHYIYSAKELDRGDESTGTKIRYKEAVCKVTSQMSIKELMDLTADTSKGVINSIFNERTIGKMIVDFENMVAKIWLLRESDKGWIDYSLPFNIGNR